MPDIVLQAPPRKLIIIVSFMHHKLQKLNKRVKEMHFSLRWLIGLSLIIGGLLWFLPILGIWMIPLGLLVLSPDFRWARRGYLSILLWLKRLKSSRRSKNTSD
ncbi:MAG: hypothetical protein V3V09_01615 [Arenicellales bacterium]